MALAVSPNDESATAKLSRKAGAVELIGDQDAIEEVVTTLQAFDAAVAGKSWQSLATDTSAKGISARHRMLLAHAAVEVSRAKDEWLDHLAREKVEREQLAKGMMEFAQLFSRESGKAAQLRAQLEASAWAKESAPPREEDEVMDEAEDVLFSANVEEGAAPGVGGGCGDNPACTTAMGAKGTGQASSVYGGAVSACAAFEQRTGAGPSPTSRCARHAAFPRRREPCRALRAPAAPPFPHLAKVLLARARSRAPSRTRPAHAYHPRREDASCWSRTRTRARAPRDSSRVNESPRSTSSRVRSGAAVRPAPPRK